MADLSPFEGADVVRSAIIITNAGDGLSENLKVEPIEIHRGDTGYLILEWECTKVQFAPSDKKDTDGDAVRVQTLRAGTAVFADAELVADLITYQKDKNLLARENEAGIQRFPEQPGCPFPGCPLEEDHDGEHEMSPDAGLTLVTEPIEVPAVLRSLTKDQLRQLCDDEGIVYPKNATGAALATALADVDGINAKAGHLLPPIPMADENG